MKTNLPPVPRRHRGQHICGAHAAATRKWRPVHWVAIAVAAFIGIGLGAATNPEPETVTETVTNEVEVEADLSAAEEQSLRDEGAADAAAELETEREAILAQGHQEGRDALAAEQAAAAEAAAESTPATTTTTSPPLWSCPMSCA